MKTMTIIDRCHFLFFIGVTKAKNNRHKDDDTKPLSLCVRGMRIEGGEEDDKLSSFVFHKSNEGKKKTQR